MCCLAKVKTGVVVGVFMALCHALWSVLVVTGVAQTVIDWIFKLHFLNSPFQIQAFDLMTAGLLVLVTFAVGFVVGLVLALLCNVLCTCSCGKK
jgi:hypothetical protein